MSDPKPGGSSLLAQARDRSRRRKELLKHTLGVDDLKSALGTTKDSDLEGKTHSSSTSGVGESDFKSALSPSSSQSPSNPSSASPPSSRPPEKKFKTAASRRSRSEDTAPEELTEAEKKDREFRVSKAFLKGTQSMNPHNDYSQNFVDTEQRPQNFIRDVGLADRFEEYPKLRELIRLKNEQVTDIFTLTLHFGL